MSQQPTEKLIRRPDFPVMDCQLRLGQGYATQRPARKHSFRRGQTDGKSHDCRDVWLQVFQNLRRVRPPDFAIDAPPRRLNFLNVNFGQNGRFGKVNRGHNVAMPPAASREEPPKTIVSRQAIRKNHVSRECFPRVHENTQSQKRQAPTMMPTSTKVGTAICRRSSSHHRTGMRAIRIFDFIACHKFTSGSFLWVYR